MSLDLEACESARSDAPTYEQVCAERDAVLAKLERVRAWASRQNAWTENELLAILDGKEGV